MTRGSRGRGARHGAQLSGEGAARLPQQSVVSGAADEASAEQLLLQPRAAAVARAVRRHATARDDERAARRVPRLEDKVARQRRGVWQSGAPVAQAEQARRALAERRGHGAQVALVHQHREHRVACRAHPPLDGRVEARMLASLAAARGGVLEGLPAVLGGDLADYLRHVDPFPMHTSGLHACGRERCHRQQGTNRGRGVLWRRGHCETEKKQSGATACSEAKPAQRRRHAWRTLG